MSNEKQIVVPDIGGIEGVEIIEVLVNAGDELAYDQPMITLETEKATMDIPAPYAGKLMELSVRVGDMVSEGDFIGKIEVNESASAPVKSAPTPEAPKETVKAAEKPQPATTPGKGVTSSQSRVSPVAFDAEKVLPERAAYASPGVRAFARTLGVNISQVNGSGRKSRIIKEDVEGFVKSAMTGSSAPEQPQPRPPSRS